MNEPPLTDLFSTEQMPFAVYVHFPWCVSKCPYCDFNSHSLRGELPERVYLEALQQDLQVQLASAPVQVSEREVTSIFLGGGTPSLFSPAAIGRVLESLRGELRMAERVEITMEANPATIERGRFAEYAAVGVNRVSLGAQSFSLESLKALGRIHSPADTQLAAEELHAVGLENFNLDLMYGLPGQDVSAAMQDVRSALALSPAQISHYHLTLEPGTPFAARPPKDLPKEAAIDEMLQLTQQALLGDGYQQYEVSAYARVGRECRHNLVYWTYGDYLGVGAGAHGKVSGVDAEGGFGIWRSQRLREPRRYQREAPDSPAWQPVPHAERAFEFMLNALRLCSGVPAVLFESRTGEPLATQEARLRGLWSRGYLAVDPMVMGQLQMSPLGLRFLNEALISFLPSQK